VITDQDGGGSRTLLLAFINRLKALADEKIDISIDERSVRKEVKSAGFDAVKVNEVVRWLVKVDKHGRAAMDDAEAMFDLYRQVTEADGARFDDIMTEARDKALLKLFAPDDQVEVKINAKAHAARTALTLSRAARAATDL
jgi:uncharacterized protein (UPF0335 family)